MDKDTEERCRCCEGTGAQSNGGGMFVVCPECKGTGLWSVALAIAKWLTNEGLLFGKQIVP